MTPPDRLHSLDALRGFALILGIFFHGTAGYVENFPVAFWPMREPSSTTLGLFFFVSHMFRMSLFFLIAGFFGRLMIERKGGRAFVKDRTKRILVPLVVGLPVVLASMGLFTALGSALGGTSLTELQAGAGPANAADRTDSFPWAHLWFLYYLAIFYALALAARAAFRRVLDREGHIRRALDAVVGGALSGVWGAALVGLPLAAYFYTVDGWPAWTGLPAPIALLPQAPSLIGYGTAFAFGWLAHRQASRLLALERRWARFAVMAVMLTSVSIYIGGTTPRFAPYLQGSPLLIFAAAYLVGAWCWVFALIGLAVRFFSDVSPARRYLSDASYWMYLMHLPVLAFFAVWLGPLQLHWTIKYSLQVAGTIVLLLVSYRYLVRPTFIGAMLNGRRYPRAAAVTVPTLKDRL